MWCEALSATQCYASGKNISMTSCTSRDVMGKYCSVSSSTFTLMQQYFLSARGEPSAVRETTVASVWRAISAASTKTFVRPVCEMKKNKSPADAASMRCISGSSCVKTGTLNLKNLCSASLATAAEVPSQRNKRGALAQSDQQLAQSLSGSSSLAVGALIALSSNFGGNVDVVGEFNGTTHILNT